MCRMWTPNVVVSLGVERFGDPVMREGGVVVVDLATYFAAIVLMVVIGGYIGTRATVGIREGK